ncbi:MAG: hypothetical protein U1D67_04875 [Dehalococcoidia bacterium]|nr:hypothetical protein [Dehalococcoidia bacterium]
MRNKMKIIFPVLALLLLIPWQPVNPAYARITETPGQDTVGIETPGEPAPLLTMLETTLPGHVYVLDNSRIVTEETWEAINALRNTKAELAPYDQQTTRSATIIARVKGLPSRLVVVNENNTIIEVWSNTTGTKGNFYSLRVKEQSVQGAEHLLTQEILTQYNHLLGELNWTATGQVYSLEKFQ